MATEIERKYRAMIVGPLPIHQEEYTTQSYLWVSKKYEWRIYRSEFILPTNRTEWWTTIKVGNGLRRKEYDLQVPSWIGHILLFFAKPPIEKVRMTCHRWEIDVFSQPRSVEGLIMAEIELHDEDEIVITPSGLELIEEVTHDSRYANKNICKNRGIL